MWKLAVGIRYVCINDVVLVVVWVVMECTKSCCGIWVTGGAGGHINRQTDIQLDRQDT